MALFTDRNTTTIEALKKYENSVLDLASSERIDLSLKLQIAREEIGLELSSFLQKRQGGYTLASVAITDGLPQWSVLHSLAVIYRDLYSNQLNDRYLAKYREYQKLARSASARFFEYGVGIVVAPLGRGSPPTLSILDAAGAPQASYYVASSWVGVQGAEGSPSDASSIVVDAHHVISADAGAPVKNAAGWNVYAGNSPSTMLLQNEAPLAAGEKWTMASIGLVEGRPRGDGQSADYLVRQNRVLPRG